VAVWRTFAALLAMVFIVAFVSANYAGDGSAQSLPLILASQVLAGALTYLGVHLGLWRLCGSPDGSEQQALGAMAAKTGRMQKYFPI